MAVIRIALGVEYDGTAFCGWQTQAGGGAVQNAIESALSVIAGSAVATVAAGRTDAGVHATGQVIHADVPASRPLSAWVRGVNSHLPQGVAVNWACPVATEFHARFSATGRRYRYLLLNRPVRPAVLAGRVGWHHQPLDVAAMREAASLLLGRHDFTSFRAAECQAKSPIRELRRAEVCAAGELIAFDFAADAFLHHMVRNLVGSLVYVGKGAHSPAWIADLLAARDRGRAAPTFAPQGLYLTGVDYDAHWGLPAPSATAFPQGIL